jgi:hypothetical protein
MARDDDKARIWLADEGFDLAALERPIATREAAAEFVPDLDSYENVIVAFSAGKDSMALVLHLLELGVPASKIELHHDNVDGGEGAAFMDWPITQSFAATVANALGVSFTTSWREGGFLREMTRQQAPTAPVWIPDYAGGHRRIGGNGPLGTRMKFPQVSADLSSGGAARASR